MICNSVLALTGVASLGIGEATIKYVAQYRARNEIASVERIIRSSLTLYLGLGFLTGFVIYLSAPLLVDSIFKISQESRLITLQSIQITAIGMLFRFANATQSAAVRGFQRYDIETRNTIIWNIGTTILACLLVFKGYGLLAILYGSIGMIAVSILLYARSLRILVGNWSWAKPEIARSSVKEIFSFGVYSWLASISNTIFTQADRFLIISLMGPKQLAYYTICLQLTQFGQNAVARTAAFIFPWSAEMKEKNDDAGLRKIYIKGMSLVTAAGCAITVPIAIWAKPILEWWVGQEIAQHASLPLTILSFFFALYATSVIPAYYLYGTGMIRMATTFSIVNAVLIFGASWIMIPRWGLLGASLAKLTIIFSWLITRTILHRDILHDQSAFGGVKTLVPVFAIFIVAAVFRITTPISSIPPYLSYLLIAGGLCSILVALATYKISENLLAYLNIRQTAPNHPQ